MYMRVKFIVGFQLFHFHSYFLGYTKSVVYKQKIQYTTATTKNAHITKSITLIIQKN